MSEQQVDWEADEVADVLRWRRREALEAGMSRLEAAEYAESEIQASELRRLVKAHCPARLLAQVLGCDVPSSASVGS
jgi:hypothetical protein